MRDAAVIVVLASSLAGCLTETHVAVVVSPEVGDTTTSVVGREGGALSLDDFRLEIPPGALAADVDVSVTVAEGGVPPSFTTFSPRYDFGPDGTRFDAPVTVAIPFDGDPATATIFWTVADGAAYAPLPTRVEGGIAYAEATHFGRAFVGSACGEGDCCDRANGDLDVLLVVDDSGSMTEEQIMLTREFPRVVRVLASGDLDGDGVQDFPALRSVRIGTITADMGVGGYVLPTCTDERGDDGVLSIQGRADVAGCAATYPPYASYETSDPLADQTAFITQVSCVATVGNGGCGFEQPLEAALKAVLPESAGTIFWGDTAGHGDGANAGFLREDSIFATVVVTDEDDCSVADPRIFDTASEVYLGDLSRRCVDYPEALHPLSRYVDGLRSVREDPDDVLFALITGVPLDLAGADYDAILADPRLQNTTDPNNAAQVLPSCSTVNGLSFPPRRLVETARGFGDDAVVTSICGDDFGPTLDAILARVSARVRGRCGAP